MSIRITYYFHENNHVAPDRICRHIKPLLLKGGRICHSEKLSGAVTAFGYEQRSTPRDITEPRRE